MQRVTENDGERDRTNPEEKQVTICHTGDS